MYMYMKTLLQMHFVFPLDGKYQQMVNINLRFRFGFQHGTVNTQMTGALGCLQLHIIYHVQKRPTAFSRNFRRCKPIFKTNRFLRKPFRYSKSCRNVHHTASVM